MLASHGKTKTKREWRPSTATAAHSFGRLAGLFQHNCRFRWRAFPDAKALLWVSSRFSLLYLNRTDHCGLLWVRSIDSYERTWRMPQSSTGSGFNPIDVRYLTNPQVFHGVDESWKPSQPALGAKQGDGTLYTDILLAGR